MLDIFPDGTHPIPNEVQIPFMDFYDQQMRQPTVVRPSLRRHLRERTGSSPATYQLNIHIDEKASEALDVALEECRLIYNRVYSLLTAFIREKEPLELELDPDEPPETIYARLRRRIKAEGWVRYNRSNILGFLIGHAISDFQKTMTYEHVGDNLMRFHFPNEVLQSDYNWLPVHPRTSWDNTFVPYGFIDTPHGRLVFEGDWLEKIDSISRTSRLYPEEIWHNALLLECWKMDPMAERSQWSINAWLKAPFGRHPNKRMAGMRFLKTEEFQRKLLKKMSEEL